MSEMWEPGTVAKVNDDPRWRSVDEVGNWRRLDGKGPLRFIRVEEVHKVTPRLDLDPDDADQILQLVGHYGFNPGMQYVNADRMTAAVRAMLPKPTPVKPEEPTGLGAVVTARHVSDHNREWAGWRPAVRIETTNPALCWWIKGPGVVGWDELEVKS